MSSVINIHEQSEQEDGMDDIGLPSTSHYKRLPKLTDSRTHIQESSISLMAQPPPPPPLSASASSATIRGNQSEASTSGTLAPPTAFIGYREQEHVIPSEHEEEPDWHHHFIIQQQQYLQREKEMADMINQLRLKKARKE